MNHGDESFTGVDLKSTEGEELPTVGITAVLRKFSTKEGKKLGSRLKEVSQD